MTCPVQPRMECLIQPSVRRKTCLKKEVAIYSCLAGEALQKSFVFAQQLCIEHSDFFFRHEIMLIFFKLGTVQVSEDIMTSLLRTSCSAFRRQIL